MHTMQVRSAQSFLNEYLYWREYLMRIQYFSVVQPSLCRHHSRRIHSGDRGNKSLLRGHSKKTKTNGFLTNLLRETYRYLVLVASWHLTPHCSRRSMLYSGTGGQWRANRYLCNNTLYKKIIITFMGIISCYTFMVNLMFSAVPGWLEEDSNSWEGGLQKYNFGIK